MLRQAQHDNAGGRLSLGDGDGDWRRFGERAGHVDSLFASGIPYELAGLVYFVFYLLMSRGQASARFSKRSKILTLAAAIVLVGAVPLHYGTNGYGIAAMLGFVALAMWSTWMDRSSPPASP
jgi:hypothetical protein